MIYVVMKYSYTRIGAFNSSFFILTYTACFYYYSYAKLKSIVITML